MANFKDENGKDWALTINVTTLKRVKAAVGVDLLAVVTDREALARLVYDPVALVDIVFVLISGQADKAGITDEQFGEAMRGDALGFATDALLDELASFFRPPQRQVLVTAIKKLREAERAGATKAIAKIETLDLADLLESGPADSGEGFTGSPAL